MPVRAAPGRRECLGDLGARFCGGQWWKHTGPRFSDSPLTECIRSIRALLGLPLATVEGAILELLEQHGSLGYEQIAALLGEPADVVRSALTDLREGGLVEALSVGELQAHTTKAASYWRLTDRGRRAEGGASCSPDDPIQVEE